MIVLFVFAAVAITANELGVRGWWSVLLGALVAVATAFALHQLGLDQAWVTDGVQAALPNRVF